MGAGNDEKAEGWGMTKRRGAGDDGPWGVAAGGLGASHGEIPVASTGMTVVLGAGMTGWWRGLLVVLGVGGGLVGGAVGVALVVVVVFGEMEAEVAGQGGGLWVVAVAFGDDGQLAAEGAA